MSDTKIDNQILDVSYTERMQIRACFTSKQAYKFQYASYTTEKTGTGMPDKQTDARI